MLFYLIHIMGVPSWLPMIFVFIIAQMIGDYTSHFNVWIYYFICIKEN